MGPRRHDETPARRAPTPGRARWGSLSRDVVVDAAARMIRERSFDQVTIRGLAGELGVAPMALYRHVRDRADLLDEVVDGMLSGCWEPEDPTPDPTAWVTDCADRLRRLLVDQPAALEVYLAHPVVSPAAVRRMEAILDALRACGLPDDEAHRAYAAIQTFTVGFAALQASRAAGKRSKDAAGGGLADELAAYTEPRQFADGLSYLLEGIRQHAHPAAAAPKEPEEEKRA